MELGVSVGAPLGSAPPPPPPAYHVGPGVSGAPAEIHTAGGSLDSRVKGARKEKERLSWRGKVERAGNVSRPSRFAH